MPSEWFQVVISVLFVSIWLMVGQIVIGDRRAQQRQSLSGVKNV